SAQANQKLYTDSLPAPEWLNISAFPTAQVEIIGIAGTLEAGFTSTARLTLKGITVEAPFAFTLNIDGNTADMTGQTVLQRTPLNLGQDSDPTADWVSEDVTVGVKVIATRTQ
ncbi:MAG: YceI family protein, partial [Pseudomonadota bacterium]